MASICPQITTFGHPCQAAAVRVRDSHHLGPEMTPDHMCALKLQRYGNKAPSSNDRWYMKKKNNNSGIISERSAKVTLDLFSRTSAPLMIAGPLFLLLHVHDLFPFPSLRLLSSVIWQSALSIIITINLLFL